MNNTSKEKMPSSIVDAQLQRLLEIVDGFRNQQCEVLLSQAREQAKQMVRHTYRNARNRLRTSILEDRQQLDQSLASVRAKRHTFIMQQKHQASRLFLDDSWKLLKKILVQRWGETKLRQLWVKSIIDVAIDSLPAIDWLIEHNDTWTNAEQKQWVEYIKQQSERKIKFQVLENVKAGIRITGGGAVVDGTLEGLLNDRVRVESEILAQCTHCIVQSTSNVEN